MPQDRRRVNAKGGGGMAWGPPRTAARESFGSMEAPTDSEILKSKSRRSARVCARSLVEEAKADAARANPAEVIAKPRLRLPRHTDLRRLAADAAQRVNDVALHEIDERIAGYVRRLDKLTRSIEKISTSKPTLPSSQVMGWHAASDNLKSLLAQAQRERIAYVETARHQPKALPRVR